MEYLDLIESQASWSTSLIATILNFLPKLGIALVIWVVAWWLAKVVASGMNFVLDKIGLNILADKTKINAFLSSANFKMSFVDVISKIVYWIIYLVGINIAFETMGLYVISDLIAQLIVYIPNLFVAVLIILVWAFIADFVKDITDGTMSSSKIQVKGLGRITYIIIMIFTVLTALRQAQVDIGFLTDNINTIVMGIMLALGLAFGLGGKDKAKEIIDKYLK